MFYDPEWRTLLVMDPTPALAWMIGLPDVVFLDGDDGPGVARVHIETAASPVGCPSCGVLTRAVAHRQLLMEHVLPPRPAGCKPVSNAGRMRRWSSLPTPASTPSRRPATALLRSRANVGAPVAGATPAAGRFGASRVAHR